MPARKIIETANLGPALSRRPSSEFPLSAAKKNSSKIETGSTRKRRGENIRAFARRHGRDVKG
jgi:hypothetical protein